MNNLEVIKAFLKGKQGKTPLRNINGAVYNWQGRTLQTDGQELINYKTKIAYIDGDFLMVTNHKYSQTTSKTVNQLAWEARNSQYIIMFEDF